MVGVLVEVCLRDLRAKGAGGDANICRCCCCCCCRLQDTIVAAGYVLHIGQVAAGAEIKVGDAVTTK